jgi:hypothetical protein
VERCAVVAIVILSFHADHHAFDVEERMPPKLNVQPGDLELFRSRLENIIDQRHPLVRLARLIDWPLFEARFGVNRAGNPGGS